ncbi:hypothetical protein AX15_007700 [Amanita polypyramis BW_CC]|nr:hypothetical protein AX15_007700 [Amanita polypyramis BW_CC]
MLHYPLQLTPKLPPNDTLPPNDSRRSSLTAKRPHRDSLSRSPFSHPHSALSLSFATNISSPSPSARLSKSPYISSCHPSSRPVSIPNASNLICQSSSSPSSVRSSLPGDVLAPGDSVGEGSLLQGEALRLVTVGPEYALFRSFDYKEPAREFEVVKRLGTGSYAVVYLVQEVLFRRPPSEDGHMSTIGQMDLDGKVSRHAETVYGREYAIKCLSKANLDEEALVAQMTEVTIHQSLKSHPNIVTLHRTLETSSFLLLVLEYVPGEDLFYFLEQARDHYDSDSQHSDAHTPPTPSLLSNMHPSQLLSRTRLRLIASMFSQMCDAVAACHDQQVFHRDIKPENFIVTDGWVTLSDGRQDRKVIVKLTDFGLSTTDIESSDMDCGSAPYMSYECRNNVAPTYHPRAADVWSLGIVLINMLYHCNPWTDTEQAACSSFDSFLRDPIKFFVKGFPGMTSAVAEFLASRVFRILEGPDDESQRISAKEFGLWVKNLPILLGGHGMQRTVSNSSTQGHPLQVSTPVSHRPSSRHPSGNTSTIRTPVIPVRSLSRAPSLGPAYEREEPCELSTVLDQEPEVDERPIQTEDTDDAASRSTSHQRRRRRGIRKGKGSSALTGPGEDTLTTLAGVTQNLARELSKTSMASSRLSVGTKASQKTRHPHEPVLMYALPTPLLNTRAQKQTSYASEPPPAPVTKKPSKWKLTFGKANAPAPLISQGHTSLSEGPIPPSSIDFTSNGSSVMSSTATNVSNLINSLSPATSTQIAKTEDESWARGRKARGAFTDKPSIRPSTVHHSDLAASPPNARSYRHPTSSASSTVSSNWRTSTSTMSSAGTSTSAFTRYSNSSARSISTAATSISSTSWRASVKASTSNPNNSAHATLPKNVKVNSIPWELDDVPRGQYLSPNADSPASPPQSRKQRTKKKLDTITERPAGQKIIEYQRRDASTSTTDLGGLASGKDDSEQIRRVQKGQINALAKMLSALRR